MTRGTTPTIRFRLDTDLDFNEVEVLFVTIQQFNDDEHELSFDKDRCVLDNDEKTIELTLTQEDTLFFDGLVKVQVRMKTADGNAFASNIETVTIDEVLLEEEI